MDKLWNISDIVSQNSVISFQELKDRYKLKESDILKYLQLTNWITTNFNLENIVPTEIGGILIQKDKRDD